MLFLFTVYSDGLPVVGVNVVCVCARNVPYIPLRYPHYTANPRATRCKLQRAPTAANLCCGMACHDRCIRMGKRYLTEQLKHHESRLFSSAKGGWQPAPHSRFEIFELCVGKVPIQNIHIEANSLEGLSEDIGLFLWT